MQLEEIKALYAYNRWANLRLFGAVEKLDAEQFTRNVVSSFPSARETLTHMIAAEWIWLRRWQGESPSAMPSAQKFEDVAALKIWWLQVEQERERLLGQLDSAKLNADLTYRNIAGKEFTLPLVQLMQHVVNHSTYHRGQMTTILRQLGAETVQLDLVYFFLEQQASKASAS